MRSDVSLRESFRKYAFAQQFFLFALVVVSLATILVSFLWQRKTLSDAVEISTQEEAKSFARILLYDLAFDPRLKRIAHYEEQLSILSGKNGGEERFYTLGLKALVRKNLDLPESTLMQMATGRGYAVRLSDIQAVRGEILAEELEKESKIMLDDLFARVTFSDHLRAISIRSKRGSVDLNASEEAISRHRFRKDELVKVEFPLFLDTTYYGDVEVLVGSWRLRRAQDDMVRSLAVIQWVLSILLGGAIILSAWTWLKFFKKVEAEIVSPITSLTERMELREREGNYPPGSHRNELMRLNQAFDDLISRLEKQRDQLLKAEKLGLMERLGAGLSHELNNALNPMRLRLDSILLEGGTASREDIGTLREHLEAARKILKDLTLVSSSKKLPDRTPLRPSQWMGAVRRLFEPQASGAIAVAWDYEESRPEILGSEDALIEMALNLLLNARDAVEGADNPEIRVSLREEGGAAVFRVEDNGAGFSEDYLANALEPFFTTKAQGMGLGLFIVETYARRMGGELSLENGSGGGAVVKLLLPLAGKEA